MKLKDRLKALGAAIASAEQQFGEGTIFHTMTPTPTKTKTTCSSGSLGLDWALGTGGWPQGKIIEIYGPASSGKTTLALHAIRECQDKDGIAAFIDAEHAFNPLYASQLGVKVEEILLSKPPIGEDALRLIEVLLKTNEVDLIVIDSVAALLPKTEWEGGLGERQGNPQARMMSQALRRMIGTIAKTKTTIIFINQIRHAQQEWGYQEITPGGNALKFFASMRIDLRILKGIRDGKHKVGQRVRAKVIKNKITLPFREAEFIIRYGTGIDREAELLDWGETFSLINRNGAWYEFDGKSLGQGHLPSCLYLREHPKIRDTIQKQLQIELKKYAPVAPSNYVSIKKPSQSKKSRASRQS